MNVSAHHELMCDTLTQVYDGKINRLLINIPPGFSKTEIAVYYFIAWTLARNPRSRFIHATYGDQLALYNSSKIREIVLSPQFQAMWPMSLRTDSQSKAQWFTEKGGGVNARAAGGQIIGFRAGQPPDPELGKNQGPGGAFVVDDPIKADDRKSEKVVKSINERFTSTFKSRLMFETTPFIVIGQRIGDNDPSNHLLTGGMGCDWHHLILPALITKNREYPKKYTHGKLIEYNLPEGPLWEWKMAKKELVEIEESDPDTKAAQYDQEPNVSASRVFKEEWWGYYSVIPKTFKKRFIYADTAQKKGEFNDFTVFLDCGLGYDGHLYVLRHFRAKIEAPDLRTIGEQFWNEGRETTQKLLTPVSCFKIEDKVSGTGLIQELRRIPNVTVKDIQRSKNKVERALDATPQIAKNLVLLPSKETFLSDAKWVNGFIAEFNLFSKDDTHAHDDQVDPLVDAVNDLLGGGHIYDRL